MKSSDARASIFASYRNANGEDMHALQISLQLSDEDMHILLSYVLPVMEKETGHEQDLGDVILACLTYGIHKSYEDITGKPFTLRMDRKKPKA